MAHRTPLKAYAPFVPLAEAFEIEAACIEDAVTFEITDRIASEPHPNASETGRHMRRTNRHTLQSLALLFTVGFGVAWTQNRAAAQAVDTANLVALLIDAGAAPQMLNLASRVELDVEQVPLSMALARLVRAGAPLVYPTDLVGAAGPATCRCSGYPLRAALEILLRGSGIQYRELDTGEILLLPIRVEEAPMSGAGIVRGRVVEAKSQDPIYGVSVTVVGTSLGALTDEQGEYLILGVPPGRYVIQAAAMGYKAARQPVTVQDAVRVVADFALEVDPVTMNPMEVEVSTGSLVATERKKIGHATVVISEEEIQDSGARDLLELLQGRAAGVASFRTGGEVGAPKHIQLRGVGSIMQDQSPLIYIDGIPVDAGSSARNGRGLHALGPGLEQGAHIRLDELTLNAIERVEIIKGPAATTMYGTEGMNGVIQIFTKRGTPGETRITARLEQGFGRLREAGELEAGALYTRQIEALFRPPRTQEYGVDMSGGAGNISYTLSVLHDREDGAVLNNSQNQTVIRTTFRVAPNEQFSVHLNGSLVQRGFTTRNYSFGLLDEVAFNFAEGGVSQLLEERTRIETDVSRLYGSITVNYQPLPIWQSRLVVGVDQSTEENENIGPQFEIGSNQPLGFTRDRVTRDFHRFTGNFVTTLSYPRNGSVTSTFSAGAEAFRDDIDRFRLRAAGLPGIEATDFDLAEQLLGGDRFFPTDLSTDVVQVGGFVQEQVGLWDRLFLTGGLRVDGNSSFGDDYGLQVYPKLAASYTLQPQAWWDAKLRGAWGRSGQAPPPFAKDLAFELIRSRATGQPTLVFSDAGNAGLQPELGTEWEVGVENYFSGNRASLELNYFQSVTEDAIIRGPLPLSTGFLQGPLVNIGELRSKGVELAAHATPIDQRDLTLRIGLALTHLIENGLITELGSDSLLTRFNQGFNLAELEGLQVGFSTRDLLFTTAANDSVISAGSRVPTTYGGVSLDLDFLERAQLHANVIYNFGGHGFNSALAARDREVGFHRYTATSLLPELADRYVFQTDLVRLDVIRLLYDLPQGWFSRFADETRIWLEADNLVSWDVFPRGDPLGVPVEGQRFGATGVRGLVVPTPQRYKIGLQMTF